MAEVTTSPAPSGFGHSKRRLLVEIGGAILILGALVLGAFKLASCMAGTLVGFVPTSLDESIGESAWEQLAPLDQRCDDPATLAYVDALTAPLVAALEPQPFTFRFAVADTEDVNAYALPGGYVTINLGLLKKAESGEEIAGVVGHELFHVIHRHGMTRIVRSAGGRVLLGLIFGWSDLGALMQYAGDLVDLSYDRDQELEADDDGRALLKRAGIDPGGLAKFFERLRADGGAASAVPQILSTHPDHGERIAESIEDAKGFTPTVRLPAPPADLRCKAEGAGF
jgi:predicted Zn-dependent protease